MASNIRMLPNGMTRAHRSFISNCYLVWLRFVVLPNNHNINTKDHFSSITVIDAILIKSLT